MNCVVSIKIDFVWFNLKCDIILFVLVGVFMWFKWLNMLIFFLVGR